MRHITQFYCRPVGKGRLTDLGSGLYSLRLICGKCRTTAAFAAVRVAVRTALDIQVIEIIELMPSGMGHA
jgi:hypothetical protein